MYYYEISWSWNDDYVPITLVHEQSFDDKEFKNMVDRAVRFALVKLFDEDNKKNPKKRSQIGFCRWDEISKIMLDYLKDHGFEELKIRSDISYFGMFIFEKDLPEKEYERFEDICGEELANKMIRYNEEVEKQFLELDKS